MRGYNVLKSTVACGALAVSSMAAIQPLAAQPAAAPVSQSAAIGVQQTQSGSPDTADASRTEVTQDIVVTARKTSERLQSTPIAVTALPAAELKARSVQTIADLSSIAPSLHSSLTALGGTTTRSFYIRGVGQVDSLPTTDPGVGVYVDGIYLARATGNLFDLADVQQVEVLRGPQGTLFGKNTEGGAISITTKRPTGNLDGDIDLIGGSYDRFDAKGNIEFPIADRLAGSLSVAADNQDGYGKSLVTGNRLGASYQQAARASLNWTPSEKFSYYVSADYTQTHGTNPPLAIVGIYPSAARNLYYSRVVAKTYPGSTFTNALITSDPLHTFNDANDRNVTHVGGISGIGTYNLGSVTFKSLSALREQSVLAETDTFGTPIPITDNTRRIRETQITQEFQAIGSLLDSRLKYVGGFFYEHETASVGTDQDYTPGFFAIAHVDQHILADTHQTDNSYAGYGNVSFKITDKLSASAGVRYSVERKAVTQVGDFVEAGTSIYDNAAEKSLPTGSVIAAAKTYRSTTPTFGLQYQATRNAFFYASYSEGFKSGGFDARPISGLAAPASFEPEHVINYEVGSKLDLLDHHARLNTAFFWTKYRDLAVQATVTEPNGFNANQITNAGAARIRGIEVEGTLLPLPGLELTANGSFLDAKLLRLDPGVPFTLNDHLTQTPKWTANVGAAYTIPLHTGATFKARLDYVYTSAVYNELPNSYSYNATGSAIVGNGPNDYPSKQPRYGLLNARVTFTNANAQWEIAAFGTNLTDKLYRTFGFSSTSFGDSLAYFGPPREIGVEFTRHFR